MDLATQLALLLLPQALQQAGIHAVYSGHDHGNDFSALLSGLRLAYGRKSGYGGYGPPAGWLRGARVILLREGEVRVGRMPCCRVWGLLLQRS